MNQEREKYYELYDYIHERTEEFYFGHDYVGACFECADGYCFSFSGPCVGSDEEFFKKMRTLVIKRAINQKEHPIRQ